MPKYNMNRLEKRITEKFGSQAKFAEAAGLEPSTVSRLLDRGDWKASQMRAAAIALKIPKKDFDSYFFDEDVAEAHEETS